MSPKKSVVSVIIVNYNNEDKLRINLSSIVELEKNSKNLIIDTIIVDDASSDESVKFIKENFPKIKLIKHKIRRGIASALNTGVRSAKGDHVLMISPAMIPEKNIINYLISRFDQPNIFAVSYHEKGNGPVKAIWKDGYVDFKFEKEPEQAIKNFYVYRNYGMYSRAIWIELGGMDEKLFPYFLEDLDICFRSAKKGYHNLWEPKALVSVGDSNNDKKYDDESILLFIWKNIHSLSLMRKHLWGVLNRIVKKPGHLIVFFGALAKLAVVFKERRKEKKGSRVSDEAIFSNFG